MPLPFTTPLELKFPGKVVSFALGTAAELRAQAGWKKYFEGMPANFRINLPNDAVAATAASGSPEDTLDATGK